MTDLIFRTNVSVELIDWHGTDFDVVRAARVSTGSDKVPSLKTGPEEHDGLIRFLMKNRHGTPFEHNSFTFRVEAPIFVWREFMRHRVGWSYNEESGRYKQLDPVFYLPGEDRNLIQQGKAGQYTFVPGSPLTHAIAVSCLARSYTEAYEQYENMLDEGIAREVARMCLPVAIFSSAYVTCNARSLMSFLSLRTKNEDSTFPSFPQREIEMVAEMLEDVWATKMPLTAKAFREYGSVSP